MRCLRDNVSSMGTMFEIAIAIKGSLNAALIFQSHLEKGAAQAAVFLHVVL